MLWQAIELWQAPVSWNFSLDEYFSGIFYIILGKKKKEKKRQGKEARPEDIHYSFSRPG